MTTRKPTGAPQALLRVGQLAGLLNVSPATIYRLAKNGRIPGVRVGGQWRFRREDCDGWLEGRPLPAKGTACDVTTGGAER